MVLLSLLLHGAVVFVPNRSSNEQPDVEAEVSIQIAPAIELLPAPDHSLEPEEDPDLQPSSPGEQEPLLQEPLLSEASPQPPLQSPQPPLTAATPEPTISEPSPSNETLPPAPPTDEPIPFSAFPHYSSRESGCYGLNNCHRVASDSFRNVGNTLRAQLESEGFEVNPRDDLEDTGVKIYEVAQDGKTQYLSALQHPQGGAIYILAAEPIMSVTSLEEQSSLIEAEFEAVLQQVEGGQSAQKSDFPYPDFFFEETTLRPEIQRTLYVSQEISQVSVSLTNQLVREEFTVDLIGTYAGNPIYQISKGALLTYLSMLPTQDEVATLLVSWNQLPQQLILDRDG